MSEFRRWGGWLLVAVAALSFVVALYDYFIAWGIHYTIGSAIVAVSTAMMLVAVLVVVFATSPTWIRVVLGIGLVLDFIGTAVAAYFLDSYLLAVLVILAGIAWLVFVLSRHETRKEQPA